MRTSRAPRRRSRFAKIIIQEDFPPDTYVDEAGVYVLIRADDWMAGWLDREPWTRVDLGQTIRIISVLFYGVRLGSRDGLDEIAAAIASVVLELPPEIGLGGGLAPLPPHRDVRVSYPAVLLSAVALDTSAPGGSIPLRRRQIGFRFPRGAPRPLREPRAGHARSARLSASQDAPRQRKRSSCHPGSASYTKKSSPSRHVPARYFGSADSSVPIQRHC